MQTLSGIILEGCLAGGLIVPGFVARAFLHCREDMDQAGLSPPFCQDLFDAVILTKGIDLSDELDLNIILGGDCLHMGADLLSQGIGKMRVVEDPDLVHVQKSCHATVEAPPREGTLDHHPVIAGDNSRYLFTVTLCE